MFKTVIFLTLYTALASYSAYGKVIITEEKLPDISNNLIPKETKPIPAIQIELPVYKEILHKIIPPKKDQPETTKVEATTTSNNTLNTNESTPAPTTTESPKKCQTDNLIDNVLGSEESIPCEVPVKVDNGTALILTPFIEKGQIEEARNASIVNSDIFLGYQSYSGFLTVNKTYNSNIFFWYFPVEGKPVNETPWIIWLQGGPGASSMTGLFDEIGPFKVNPAGTLKKNPFTWLQNHSLVFIDNPVGTGYSFTEHADGYVQDMSTYGMHLHETVQQLVQLYPELRSAPLFIAGESYGGKYVPALAMEIHKHKDLPGLNINLEGMIIGNAYVDPNMISHVTLPFYYFGLLNKEQLKIVDPLLKSFQSDIASNNSIAAKNKWNSLIAVLLFLSHQKQAYNFLKDDLPVGRYINFLKTSEVKKALHVGDIKFSFVNMTVNSRMSPDFLSSSKRLFEELLVDYRVLAYCGQLDQMLPCVFTSEHYRTWQWNGSAEFLEATRYPYIYNAKRAGYHKSGGHLTEVVIRGAGHMVPVDEPAPTQNLVARWTHNKPLSQRFGLLEGSYVQEFVKNSSMIYL
ncbi:venom serine carboxypeptidase-like [Vanessa cardui]|uniref:venom serine carboxypeptidase-like n=1 Tax=Vanessa cardui TaxID=171605 RepID=UPI001F146053|nr:venom serine carboxypeptidase-like [Vanessa cardui]